MIDIYDIISRPIHFNPWKRIIMYFESYRLIMDDKQISVCEELFYYLNDCRPPNDFQFSYDEVRFVWHYNNGIIVRIVVNSEGWLWAGYQKGSKVTSISTYWAQLSFALQHAGSW